MPGPTPKLLALVVCDEIIQDRRSNKFSLIGIFSALFTSVIPTVMRPVGVYAKLVDAQGEYAIKLELVRRRDLHVIGTATGPPIHIEDRLQPFELAFALPPTKFDESGPYEFRLIADNNHVGSGPFDVIETKPEEPQK